MSDHTIGKNGEQPTGKNKPSFVRGRRLSGRGVVDSSQAAVHSDHMILMGVEHTGHHKTSRHAGGHQPKKDRNKKGRK